MNPSEGKIRFQRLIKEAVPLLMVCLSFYAISGCTESRRTSYPSDIPSDEALEQSGISRTRWCLAHDLATDARESMEEGRIHEALRWARMAASINPAHSGLEEEARVLVAEYLVDEAGDALDDYEYGVARRRIRAALDVKPDLQIAHALSDQIDSLEAADLVKRAQIKAERNDHHAAYALLSSAVDLQPHNKNYAEQLEELVESSRELKFSRLSKEVKKQITAGDLEAAIKNLKIMEAIDASNVEFDKLKLEVEERVKAAETLHSRGLAALEAEQFEEAIDNLLAASQINSDLGLEPTLRDARFRQARQLFVIALDEGDRLTAYIAAREMNKLVDDPEIKRMLPQLEKEVIEHSQQVALELHREGRTTEAVEYIEIVLESVSSPQLQSLLVRLKK